MSRGVSPMTQVSSRGCGQLAEPARSRAIAGSAIRSSSSEPNPPWPGAKYRPSPARWSLSRAIGSRLPVTSERSTSVRPAR